MKKYLMVTCAFLIIFVSAMMVANAYFCGPDDKYYVSVTAGKDLLTHWVEATMNGYGHKRRLTVHNGTNEKTSKWYSANNQSDIVVKVSSSYFNNDAWTYPEFEY